MMFSSSWLKVELLSEETHEDSVYAVEMPLATLRLVYSRFVDDLLELARERATSARRICHADESFEKCNPG